MKNKVPKSDWAIVAIIGLLMQGIWLISLDQPSYMDAYYYTTNGERLADGFGFTELVIWQYLDDPAGLPTPSHSYWMPLPSVLAGLGYAVQEDFLWPKLIFWLMGGSLPLLAFGLSRLISGERWQAWVAAMLTATGSFYGAFLSQPSTFAPFAWAGGICLLALGLIGSAPYRRVEGALRTGINALNPALLWLAAGIFAGLAHLTRADGILLLVVALVLWVYGLAPRKREQARHGKGGSDANADTSARTSVGHLIFLVAGYLVIMGPWMLRNVAVIGKPFSPVGLQSVFLTTYDDLFAYGRDINLASYLDWGLGNIIKSKLESLWIAIQTLTAVPGIIFITPFTVIAMAVLFKQPEKRAFLRPFLWFVILLVFTMSFVFTFPGMRGAIFHSSSAIWPWSTVLGAFGLGIAVDWTAARLKHWEPAKAKIRFSLLFIFLALILGLYVSYSRTRSDLDIELLNQLRSSLPQDAVVMAGNAPGVHYHTGLPSLSVPNEPAEVVYQAARRYGVTHLMLDKDTPVPLRGFYLGQETNSNFHLLQTIDDIKLYEVAVQAP